MRIRYVMFAYEISRRAESRSSFSMSSFRDVVLIVLTGCKREPHHSDVLRQVSSIFSFITLQGILTLGF